MSIFEKEELNSFPKFPTIIEGLKGKVVYLQKMLGKNVDGLAFIKPLYFY